MNDKITATPEQQAAPLSASDVGSRILGQIVAILSQSPPHRHLFLADLEWFAVPALLTRQLRIFQNEKGPFALATWASISEDVERELIAGRQRLKPSEWKSGDRLWLIELVCPASLANPKVLTGLLNELSDKVFKGKPCKMRVMDQKTGKFRVGELGRKPTAN